MARLRILERKAADTRYYKIEERFWFWWIPFIRTDHKGYTRVTFNTIQDAEEYIKTVTALGKIVKEITI